MNESFNNIRLVCGVRGAGMGAGEGVIAFAAKRNNVPDGRAPGIEAVMAGGVMRFGIPLAP